MKKNYMGCSSLLCLFSVEQKCTCHVCGWYWMLLCVWSGFLYKRIVFILRVPRVVRKVVGFIHPLCFCQVSLTFMQLVFLLHLSFLAYVIFHIRFYLTVAVAGVVDMCIKSELPMVVSCISDTYWCGGIVVKTLRYKPVGRGFDSRWCNFNF